MDKYMVEAINLAKKAIKHSDIPIAALIVENGKIISKACNQKEKNADVTAHAEIIAIRRACKKKKSNYLNDCILYVTVEPCMMCTGAISQAHIKEVIYCLDSPKYGYLKNININHRQMYDEEYEQYLKNFFKENLR